MQKISHLEDHLGYWLRIVSSYVSHDFNKKLKEREFTIAEWVLLRLLYESQEMTPGNLAEVTGITRGAVTKVIDKLLEKDLVQRIESLEDRRFQLLRLTRKGQSLVPSLAKLADENEKSYFSFLSKEEQRMIIHILKRVVKQHKLDKMPID